MVFFLGGGGVGGGEMNNTKLFSSLYVMLVMIMIHIIFPRFF